MNNRSASVDSLARLANSVIRASAGTGKTFQLSSRYLQLVLGGHPPDRILAATFTRKAAGEILERIVYRLAAAAGGPQFARRLGDELGMPALDVDACQRALERLTSNLHRLRIGTLDSFFLQATQTLSLEVGLPPGWQIVDELEEPGMRDEALSFLLQQCEAKAVLRLMHWLSKGETQRGVYRLMADTVEAMYQLYRESPQKAWKRLERPCPLDEADVLLRLEGVAEWLGCDQGTAPIRKAVAAFQSAVAERRWEDALNCRLSKTMIASEFCFARSPLPTSLIPLLDPLVQHARAQLQLRFLLQLEASRDLLEMFHGQFEALKLERRALCFSDLPRYLGSREDAMPMQQLAFRLDAHIDSLLLDEFQDTSLEQWRALRPFAQHAAERHANRSLFCVGDMKQAIYGWRGGDSELLDAIATELPEVEVRQLDQSYRSSPAVIEAVNRINQRMDQHPKLGDMQSAVQSWCENFPEHCTVRENLPGYVALETCAAGSCNDERRDNAIQLAAERVDELRRRAPQLSIAVLVRTNENVGRVIYALQQRGILASEEGGNPLTDAAAVLLVLSLLQLADYPHDRVARFHLARSPWGPLLELPQYDDDVAAERLSRSVRCLLLEEGYGTAVDRWAAQLRPLTDARECRRLDQLASLAYEYQTAIENPRQIGYHRQQRRPLRTVGFRQMIERHRVIDPSDDPVRVMTVHQSKGLQFDVVILPDLDRKLIGQTPECVFDRAHPTQPIRTVLRYVSADVREFFPSWVGQVHDHHTASTVRESLCTLYVAVTRAIHSLHLIVWPAGNGAAEEGGDEEASDKPCKKASKAGLPQTLAGLIRAALTDHSPLPSLTRVVELGDPDWIRRLPPAPVPVARRMEASLPPVRLARPAAEQRASVQATVNPSRLEGGGRVRLRDRWSLPNQTAMLRGTLIHAFFEQIAWLENGVPEDGTLMAVGMTLEADKHQIDEAIQHFRRQLGNPQIRHVLCRSHYAPWQQVWPALREQPARGWTPASGDGDWRLEVRREQRLSALEDAGLVSGSIDRLVLLSHRQRPVAAEIIDFKTDRVDSPAVLQQRAAYYRPQLHAYAAGVSRMLCIDRAHVNAKLLFVHSGDLVNV